MTAQLTRPARPSQRSRVIPRPRITRAVALSAIYVGALMVLALWWNDTNFVSGLDGWLTNAGRITGLECGYGIVVLLALMSRAPVLEREVGTDRLVRWHAIGGRYIVCLVVAHTALITWGYALTAHRSIFGETADLNTQYADVLMATVALGLLLLVGITSARAARRRLAYETWHYVHLYTYLAVALSFSHQFSTGADFTDLRARILWSALYIAVALLLIRYRVVAPLLSLRRHQFRVAEVRAESPDTISLYITGRNLAELHAESGQFFRWRFLTRDLWWVASPYSLSAPARRDHLRITVQKAGTHSAQLAKLRPGTRVLAEGPYGSFTGAQRSRAKVLLIAGGVGITPIRALFESLPGRPGDVTLIYRASSPVDIILKHEIDEIAAWRGARVHYLVGPRRPGAADFLSARSISQSLGDIRNWDVYLCGPESMTTAVRESLRQLRVPPWRIHYESFAF
ncbi:Predicted ferric reductase [Frankineae bacterium MT45]|nr:Predicted ferric reductase [Frankineae bacterium MT45]